MPCIVSVLLHHRALPGDGSLTGFVWLCTLHGDFRGSAKRLPGNARRLRGRSAADSPGLTPSRVLTTSSPVAAWPVAICGCAGNHRALSTLSRRPFYRDRQTHPGSIIENTLRSSDSGSQAACLLSFSQCRPLSCSSSFSCNTPPTKDANHAPQHPYFFPCWIEPLIWIFSLRVGDLPPSPYRTTSP